MPSREFPSNATVYSGVFYITYISFWFFKNFIVPTFAAFLSKTYLPCRIFFMKTNDIKGKSKYFIQIMICFWHSNYAIITSFESVFLIALVIVYVAL